MSDRSAIVSRHGSASSRLGICARRYFPPILLLLGICLCIIAFVKLIRQPTVALHATAATFALASIGAAASLWLSAVAWQGFLSLFAGARITLGEALAQNGLVLIGKYVPGKIAGLAARIVVNASSRASQVTVATVVETLGTAASAVTVGSVLYVANYSLLASLCLICTGVGAWWFSPSLVSFALPLLGRLSSRLRGVAPDFGPNQHVLLRRALLIQGLQWIMLSLVVVAVATIIAPSASASVLLKLAGSYGLAVALGAAAIVFPGGIGPREGAFVWLAHGVVGIPEALAMALCLRIVTTLIDIAGAACWIAHRSLRRV
ncbi:MAG: hypothetical protein WBQ57_09375 [Rhodanobacteraceae bacterium]